MTRIRKLCPKCNRLCEKDGGNWFPISMSIMSHSFGCDYDLNEKEVINND